MRFDYLHDAPPETVDRVRAFRVGKNLRFPLASLATVLFTCVGACGIFSHAIAIARASEIEAEARFQQSKADLARAQIERLRVDDLIALDARLRDVRLSGTRVSARLADIANRMPAHAWLTSLVRNPDGISIRGESKGLPTLSETIVRLLRSKAIGSPTLVRASKEERSHAQGLLSFEVQVEERSR